MPAPKKETINTAWFKTLMKNRGLTQQRIADELGLSNSTVVSHILAGRRKIAPEELLDWAKLLGVTVNDIFNNAYGFGNPENILKSNRKKDEIRVAGFANGNLEVLLRDDGIGPASIPNPLPDELDGNDESVVAIHLRTAGTTFDAFDGGILVYKQCEGIAPEAFGRICVVSSPNENDRIRVLNRGYSEGRYNLAYLNQSPAEQNVALTSASPVLSIKI